MASATVDSLKAGGDDLGRSMSPQRKAMAANGSMDQFDNIIKE